MDLDDVLQLAELGHDLRVAPIVSDQEQNGAAAAVPERHAEDALDVEAAPREQAAQVRVEGNPEMVFRGQIAAIASGLVRREGYSVVPVLVALEAVPADLELRPGQVAQASVRAPTVHQVLVIPVDAVLGPIKAGLPAVCSVVGAHSQIEEREIVVGLSNDTLVEVRTGLTAGEKVLRNVKDEPR